MKKIAIANRGEIAVRVISTCQEMGIIPVLLYSEADKNSLAYRLSPEKVCIGPATADKSYLNIPAVIEGTLKSGAEALHPGYGFLSEKAELAKACEENNIVFIGPPADALAIFGNKMRAREQAIKCGVPVLPAEYLSEAGLLEQALSSHNSPALSTARPVADGSAPARGQGFVWPSWGEPVIIKATKGGGGRGLRVVHSEREWKKALVSVQREAKLAFGSSEVFVEKYLPSARHIEVPFFVSAEGKKIYLSDRDCSVQRKQAKIIEEAPARLPEKVRKEMAEASMALLSQVDYRQAGTVEFLYQDGKFYFMELNPRIQVESPVTEEILGVDLIKAQILTAQGLLPFMQNSFEPRGHSIQCRIYAEDMQKHLPVFGYLGSCYFPHGLGRHFDVGYESGDKVPAFYDTLLCKLIVHAEDRERARQKIQQALSETFVFGLKTNISFLQGLISHKSFIKGEVPASFVEKVFLKTWKEKQLSDLNPALLSTLQKAFLINGKRGHSESKKQDFNPWTYFA